MALTPFRWVVALIIACLVAAVVILRTDNRQWRNADDEEVLGRRFNTLASQAAVTVGKLRSEQLIDSTRSVAARSPDKSAIRVFRDAGIPIAARAAFDSLAVRATAGVRSAGAIGIDIVFVYDTLSMLHGTPTYRSGISTSYVLPKSPTDRCTVLTQVAASQRADGLVATLSIPASVQQLLGPCAFYRAFGMPGHQIDSWLRTRGWTFAGDGSWSQAAPPIQMQAPFWNRGSTLVALGPAGTTAMLGAQRDELTTKGIACSAGDLVACEHSIVDPVVPDRLKVMNGNVLYKPYFALGRSRSGVYYYYGLRPLGRVEPFILADMVRELGRDKFGRFWTSDEPVPAAFEKAAGEPLGQWTSRWLSDQYGPMLHRPGVSASAVVVGIVLFALGIFVAAGLSARRQYA